MTPRDSPVLAVLVTVGAFASLGTALGATDRSTASTPVHAPSASAPSRYGVDAPELAALGPFAVGFTTQHLVQPDQDDVLAFDAVRGTAPRRNRVLLVDLWYPARAGAHGRRATYTASFPAEPPAPPVSFTVPGIAISGAPAADSGSAPTPSGGGASARASARGFPLVIVSHGYSNDPAAMTWLTENLASKGYVIAAIRHDDPPITDRAKFVGPLLRRPLDIAFVAKALWKAPGMGRLIDPDRVALVGYSMGGYGVLTAAGAGLDPAGPPTRMIPGGLLTPYTRGGARRADATVAAIRAVVAISPAGGGTLQAWGAAGLRGITAPLLLIAGDADRTVDYATGARAIFDTAVASPRYLLTFKNGGHSIGLSPAPEAMRQRLWDQDWFEDPVWRKERINAINTHFITAFLDLYVKNETTRAAYLDVPVPESTEGTWPATTAVAGTPPTPPGYDAFSPGTAGITLWKGFQRNHAAGLELLHATAAPVDAELPAGQRLATPMPD